MSEHITQLRLEDANTDFVPQAILRGSVEDIERLARVRFSRSEDDLDRFDAAVLRIEPQEATVRHTSDLTINFYTENLPFENDNAVEKTKPSFSLTFMMQRYDGEPRDNVTIFLPRRINSEIEVRDAVCRILRALGIPLGSLVWQRAHESQL